MQPSETEIRAALAGNLCRCTGYKPIIEAALLASGPEREDRVENSADVVALLRKIPSESIRITTGLQRYHRPVTLGEALEVKRLHPEVIVTHGATDVALRVTKKHEILPEVLDLSGIGELRGSLEEDGNVVVGAGNSMEDLAEICRDRFPAISSMLRVFGSLQIRNLATVGGNLGTASPVGDLMPLLIAHRASIVLRNVRGERRIAADQFVSGYRRTLLAEDELIAAIVLPPVLPGTLIRSYKISRRRDVDIATVSAGFRLELDENDRVRDVVLAYGGMAGRVMRAEGAEASLRGQPWARRGVENAMRAIESDFTPISDVRGSAAMRMIAARNLLLKFWAESRGNGGGPWH